MDKKNIIIIILCIVVLGLGGFVIYDRVIDKEPKKEFEPDVEPITPNPNNNNEPTFKEPIVLDEANEVVEFDDNLTIELTGTDVGGIYEYTAKVMFNGSEIGNELFNSPDSKHIWSDNAAASFSIEKINNVYFVISYIAKQQDGYYVLIFNANGSSIESFNDVNFRISEDRKTFEVSDCKTGAVDEICPSDTFEIFDTTIGKKA